MGSLASLRSLQHVLGVQAVRRDEAARALMATRASEAQWRTRRDEADAALMDALHEWSACLDGRFDPSRAAAHARWARDCEARLRETETGLAAAIRATEDALARAAKLTAEFRALEKAAMKERRAVARRIEENAQHQLEERVALSWVQS